jgi:alanine dehydrogenase
VGEKFQRHGRVSQKVGVLLGGVPGVPPGNLVILGGGNAAEHIFM